MESFVAFDIDLDWEFDAPHWCDFEKEEIGCDDTWFEEIEKTEKSENNDKKSQNETKENKLRSENENTDNVEPKAIEKNKRKKVSSPEKRSKIPIYSRKAIKSCVVSRENLELSRKQLDQQSMSKIPTHSKIPIMRSSSKNLLLH